MHQCFIRSYSVYLCKRNRTQTLCVGSSVSGTKKKAKQSSFLMPGTVISKGKVDGFRSRLRLKPVWVNQENYQERENNKY